MDLQYTETVLKYIGQLLNEIFVKLFSKEIGFALLIFEFNKPGISNYLSNADRKSMIQAIEETLIRLKNNEDIPGSIDGIQ